MPDSIELTGDSLGLEDVERVARDWTLTVTLGAQARTRITESRRFVEHALASRATIYGVTTGFGRLADVFIPPERQGALQRNLVRSHSVGIGAPLDDTEVRAIMVLRANALARGHSGCRLEVVERILDYLNRGIHPVVPETGSVGASGDLAPLAHIALGLMGEGEVTLDSVRRPTGEVLGEMGIEALVLKEKEGLALINGTQATTALGVLSLLAAERAVETAEVAGAMSLEGLRGTPEPFRAEVHEARPHPGQMASAGRLRQLMEGSEIRESHRENDPRVQDPYCLRCMPQVHGATREALTHVRRILETEVNASTDNPLIFPQEGLVVSAGNFHGQVVAQALDFLSIAVTDLAAISERRTERILNPDLSGLPAFLTRKPGLRSGMMMCQIAAVDLLAEMRVLAHPASVDSVPTSANQEDHVSMGMASARKARRAVACLEYVLAIELLCAAQALDFLEPLRPGEAIGRAHDEIRRRIPTLDADRVLYPDIETLRHLVRSGSVVRAALPG